MAARRPPVETILPSICTAMWNRARAGASPSKPPETSIPTNVKPSKPSSKTSTSATTPGRVWELEVLHGSSGVLGYIKGRQLEVSLLPIYGLMSNLEVSLDRFREFGFPVAGVFPVTYNSSHRVVEFECVCVADTAVGSAHLTSAEGLR